ncbi:MAG: transglutaminase-like domain-containing protein [Candidatus Bathyarchaeia archaeon]
MDAVIDLIQVNTGQSTTERIRRILDFIDRNIHYEYDFGNVYQASPETLVFKSGDCDDFSILAAALFEAVGIDSAIGYFSYKPAGGETQYHCMVLVNLNNLGEDYVYWYYSSITSMGLASGR